MQKLLVEKIKYSACRVYMKESGMSRLLYMEIETGTVAEGGSYCP
jgi:hypothetical protein